MNFVEGLVIVFVAFMVYSLFMDLIKAQKEVQLKELDNGLSLKEAAEYIEVLEAKLEKSKESKE